MSMKREYRLNTLQPRISVLKAREYEVRPEWREWLVNELKERTKRLMSQEFDYSLDQYLAGYVRHNGTTQGSRLVREVFGMDYWTAFTFIKDTYKTEILQHREGQAFNKSCEHFRGLYEGHWVGLLEENGDKDE